MEFFNIPLNLPSLQLDTLTLIQALPHWTNYQGLKPISISDTVALLILLSTCFGYLTRGHVWDKPDPHFYVYFERPQVADGPLKGKTSATRDISQRLHEGQHDCVIFWGSQSGRAERFSEALGQDCLARFGINALVADLSDYDAESIANIEQSHFAIFILSTYGEGDPSDNTAAFWDWLKRSNNGAHNLRNLRYLAFGLGNSNYKYYNHVLDVVVNFLDKAGATSLMAPQRGDDANGGTEEDFQSWKEDLFTSFRSMGYVQKSIAYQSNVDIEFSGEPVESRGSTMPSSHQQSNTNSPIVSLAVKSARELFTTGDRNCVHMELDLGTSSFGYKTGDHIGIWPCNPDEEVDRLIEVLGLHSRRNENLKVTFHSKTAKPKLPSPTTLATAFRHHLEICGPVTRKTVLEIANFAPISAAKDMLLELGHDRNRFEQLTTSTHITLARLLRLASPLVPWSDLPMSFVVENLLPLSPRYYSISSCSVVTPRTIAITALVVNKTLPGESCTTIKGLASNYILSASNLPSATGNPTSITGRSTDYKGVQGAKVLAHIRKTKFKLPIASSTPLILVSAGTGFAPFRAFLHERAKLHAIGKPVGKTLMFFGCRNVADFIYREEVENIQAQLGDKLKILTAFSRGENEKVYVQDRVGAHAAQVLEMLESGANMYVCGKASMAREVDAKLEAAVGAAKQLSEVEVKAWAEALKKRGKWKVDVWG